MDELEKKNKNLNEIKDKEYCDSDNEEKTGIVEQKNHARSKLRRKVRQNVYRNGIFIIFIQSENKL